MTSFVIDRSVIGTPFDIRVADGNVSKSDNRESDELVFGPNYDTDSDKSLNVALKLSGHNVAWRIDAKYVDAMRCVFSEFRNDPSLSVPWALAVPNRVVKESTRTLISDIETALKTTNLDCYGIFCKQTDLFRGLQRAHIDAALLESYISKQTLPSRAEFLSTFRPERDGFARPTRYNRLMLDDSGTRTGRLTVLSGPSYMTLNREYRDIVSSRWRGGSVWYLDYSSLEPRTFFGSVKGESLSSGFYRTLAEKIIGDSGESARAKQMFLRSFYGATSGTVAAGDEFELRHAKSMIKFVEEDFGVKESTKALLEGLRISGRICNKFGRWLPLDRESPGNVVFNNWVQSTASDVALLGFSKLVRAITRSNLSIYPVCVIHDALMIDVHPEFEKYVSVLAKVGAQIPEFGPIEFPMKAELISRRHD